MAQPDEVRIPTTVEEFYQIIGEVILAEWQALVQQDPGSEQTLGLTVFTSILQRVGQEGLSRHLGKAWLVINIDLLAALAGLAAHALQQDDQRLLGSIMSDLLKDYCRIIGLLRAVADNDDKCGAMFNTIFIAGAFAEDPEQRRAFLQLLIQLKQDAQQHEKQTNAAAEEFFRKLLERPTN